MSRYTGKSYNRIAPCGQCSDRQRCDLYISLQRARTVAAIMKIQEDCFFADVAWADKLEDGGLDVRIDCRQFVEDLNAP